MADKKAAKEIVADLDKAYNEMVNSLSLEELITHWHAEIRVHKQAREHNASWAWSAEKLAALEKAVGEFEVIYEAEKAEAEKMPISRHEARRVRKLFDEDGEAQTLSDSRSEH